MAPGLKHLLAVATGYVVALAVVGLCTPSADAAKVRKKARAAASASSSASGSAPAASTAASARVAASTSAAPPRAPTGLVCLYAKQVDDAGVARCVAPEEMDPARFVLADTSPIAERLGMPAVSAFAGPDASVDGDGSGGGDGGDAGESEDEPWRPYKARVARLSFENGGVGGAMSSIKNLTGDMAACVADHGGLRVESARLKLLFFVRADRRASGMVVASARNIPPPVVRCIRQRLEGQPIGTPSGNPVGVTLLLELKRNTEPHDGG